MSNPNDRTRLPISSHVRDKLRARKVGSETYDDVILRLLKRGGGDSHEHA